MNHYHQRSVILASVLSHSSRNKIVTQFAQKLSGVTYEAAEKSHMIFSATVMAKSNTKCYLSQ